MAALGCTKAMFAPTATGTGSAGRGGDGGIAGTDGTGDGGTSGVAGAAMGGTGGGGSGGVAGTGGSAGSAGTGGSAGVGGRGGTGGTGGGVAGTSGGAGTSGVAGTTGAGGRGGTGGAAGTGGVGGRGGTGGTGGGGNVDGGTGVRPTVAGQIVITELLHDVPGNDDDAEWFEVYNPSMTVTFDLNGCEVRDINSGVAITAPLVIPPGAFRVLAISPAVGFTPDYVYGTGIKFDSNAGDQAGIRCGGVDIDIFAYNNTDAVDPAAVGKTFSVDPRHYTATDNDNRMFWCLAATTSTYMMGTATYNGTPGRTNPQCPGVTQ